MPIPNPTIEPLPLLPGRVRTPGGGGLNHSVVSYCREAGVERHIESPILVQARELKGRGGALSCLVL